MSSVPPFSTPHVEQFQRDGFIIVPGLATADLCERMKARAHLHLKGAVPPVEYEADTAYPGAPDSRDAQGGHTVRRLLQAYARDPIYRDWVHSDGLTAPLHALLGPAVCLSQAHHNCVMTKAPAYSSVTGWHQDIRYWSFEQPALVSAWLALGSETVDNGCLRVVPGSHRLDLRRDQFDDALFFRTDAAENQDVLSRQTAAELRPGDVLLFHSRLLHSAGNNRTTLTKYALVFTFHRTDNRPLSGSRSSSMPSVVIG